MALELKYKFVINKQATEISIQDITKAYSASNEGGWGAPNTERNNVALVSYLRYQAFDKDLENISAKFPDNSVDYNLSFTNSEQSLFTYPYTKDGWYKGALIAVPTTYALPIENDIRYNTSTLKLEIFKEAVWVDLLDDEWDLLLDDTRYDLVDNQDILMAKAVLTRNCLTEKFLECLQCSNCKCDKLQEELVQMNIYIQAADYRFYTEKEFEAQRMVEKITKMFKCNC